MNMQWITAKVVQTSTSSYELRFLCQASTEFSQSTICIAFFLPGKKNQFIYMTYIFYFNVVMSETAVTLCPNSQLYSKFISGIITHTLLIHP